MKLWKKIWLELFDIISFFVFILGIILFVRFYIFNPFTVIGSSMMSTIQDGNVLLISKIDKYRSTYKKEDIIVFVPEGKTDAFIKRIIAIPGETVSLSEGQVTVCTTNTDDCETLTEEYLDTNSKTEATCNKTEFVITEWYFVLGDNRGGSTDSRCCFGTECTDKTPYTISEQNIIGKASLRILPLSGISLF